MSSAQVKHYNRSLVSWSAGSARLEEGFVNKSTVLRTACLLAALSAVTGFAWFRLSVRSKPHRVILTWHPPVPVPGVKIIGYNIYRSTVPSGSYVRLASEVREATYTDEHVDGGATYSYVVTAVDGSHRESKYSQEVTVHIPVAAHGTSSRQLPLTLFHLRTNNKLLRSTSRFTASMSVLIAAHCALRSRKGIFLSSSSHCFGLPARKLS